MKKEDKRGGWTEMWIRKFQGRHLCKMKKISAICTKTSIYWRGCEL